MNVTDFSDVIQATNLFAGYDRPWAVCGGWAIDLYLNRVKRNHKDVDFAVLRKDQLVIQNHLSLQGWTLEKAVNGQLIPWLAGEWIEATTTMSHGAQLVSEALWLLALVYLGARTRDSDGPVRHDLAWIGGLSLIPLTLWVILARHEWEVSGRTPIPTGLLLAGWAVGYGGPLVMGFLLRGKAGWAVLVAAAWVRLVGATAEGILPRDASFSWRTISTYVLCAIGSALMAWWGVHEARRERVNLAVAGFGLTVLSFYFDNVMDKLERSVSLMTLGLLFLLMGYALALTRRRLMARMSESAQ